MLNLRAVCGLGLAAVVAACGVDGARQRNQGDSGAGGTGGEGAGTSGGAAGTGAAGAGGTGAGGAGGVGGAGGTGGGGCTTEEPGPRLTRLLTPSEFTQTAIDLFGVTPDVINKTQIPGSGTVSGFDNDANAGLVTDRHVEAYLSVGSQVIDVALTTNRDALVPCGTAGGCEDQFVRTFGRSAFRRPLTDAEVTRYLGLFAPALTGGAFDEGVRLVMRAMIASPHFLYRMEVGQPEQDHFVLDSHEMATLLSYTLWGTMPDAALRTAADANELATPAGVEAHARRMLGDPRARRQIASFADQWLGTVALPNANKDLAVFPAFTDEVRAGLIEETQAFVAHVVFDSTSTFQELFAADYVFANAATASFYGIQGPTGTALEKVSVPDTAQRGGLITLGSVLATHAASAATSPIKRGAFVRRRVLCDILLPPPPDVDTTPPPPVDGLTTRERFKQHTEDPKCYNCHRLIDGIGFGLEGFDGAGAVRTEEMGKPIDESGSLEDSDAVGTALPFNGGPELGQLLAQNEKAQQCLATQYYRYSHGFVEGGDDACAAERLREAFVEAGLNIKELLVRAVLQESFARRRAP